MGRGKRRQYIINPPLQYKLMFLILFSIIIPALLIFLTLFFLIHNILVEAQLNDEMVYNALLFMSNKVYLILFFGFLLITVLLITWSTLFLHRIVGPLYRLEKELDEIIHGKPVKKLQFRKHDKIAPLANKLNTIFAMLQKTNL